MMGGPTDAAHGAPEDGKAAHASHLPQALAAIYAVAIAYASLQPFGEWLTPVAGTPFWPVAPRTFRFNRFDIVANVLAYVPLGFFVALVPSRAAPARRATVAAAAGAALSFAMETAQWFLPARDANPIDLVANAAGALAGGVLGALYAGSSLRGTVRSMRTRIVLPGPIGDVGLALVAVWLAAQTNPAIALFAVTFDLEPSPLGVPGRAATDVAALLIEAAGSAMQLVGVGLFAALLARERRHAGGAVLIVVGAALLIKGAAALALLTPAAYESWLSRGVLLGVAAGALLLLPAILLPRPAQAAIGTVALLSSLLAPLLVPDLLFAAAPLTLFNWRYGHLLNFNGLTRSILIAWPIAAAAWLFALAGQPGWGLAAAPDRTVAEGGDRL